jgi:putative transposase
MKFAFVAKRRAIWPVAWLCKALDVSTSGFHDWLNRRPAKRTLENGTLLGLIRASFHDSDRTYGARRVWRDVLAEGVSCGLHRIERLMQQNALKARHRRRKLPSDTGLRVIHAIAPNVLDRQFYATQPNRKWISDFTYIWTAEGWLYVAAVIDLFSRRAVGLLSVIALQSPVGQRVDECDDDGPACDRCSAHGHLAARQTRCASSSLRPRQPVYV